MPRDNEAELDAARMVARILAAQFEIVDTGEESGQYDVRLTMADGRCVAMEVTSFGSDDWRRTAARIQAEARNGSLAAEQLRCLWGVVAPTGIGVRDLAPLLPDLLGRLEETGVESLSSSYDGDDPVLAGIALELQALSINSLDMWSETPYDGQDRILILQCERTIGSAGALPSALGSVFEKDDNQEKLSRAECDERHLYVFMEHGGAGAVLHGQWPLPACPADPKGVIDVLWIFSPSASAYVFKVRPGADAWERFESVTGESV